MKDSTKLYSIILAIVLAIAWTVLVVAFVAMSIWSIYWVWTLPVVPTWFAICTKIWITLVLCLLLKPIVKSKKNERKNP